MKGVPRQYEVTLDPGRKEEPLPTQGSIEQPPATLQARPSTSVPFSRVNNVQRRLTHGGRGRWPRMQERTTHSKNWLQALREDGGIQ